MSARDPFAPPAEANGADVFRDELARARPDLADPSTWAALASRYAALTHTDALLTRADVDDLRDPRWHVSPLSRDDAAQWEPPHLESTSEGAALVFVVHDRGALYAVRVTRGYAVEIVRRA